MIRDRSGQAQRGAALILVLVLVAALSVALAGALPLARLEIAGESTEAAAIMAAARAESGLVLAAKLLSADASGNRYDGPGDVWAACFASDAERARLAASGQVNAVVLDLFADGALTGTVIDETGKISVNALAGGGAGTYARILRDLLMGPAFNLPEAQATQLVLDIKDWVDADTEPSVSQSLGGNFASGHTGVEAPYYAAQGADRQPPNRPMAALGELLRIRGVTRALYDGQGGLPGLKDLLTVYGTGAEGINVNTAPEAVLTALAWPNGESVALAFARDVVDFRSQKGNEGLLENPQWVRTTLTAYQNLVITGVNMVATGKYFQARLAGVQGSVRVGLAAWFKRESDGTVTVLARQRW